MHSYVAPGRGRALGPEGLKQERNKIFYVSPFLDMPMRYHFRIRPPVDDVAVRILENRCEGPILSATFHGRRVDLTTGAVLKLSLAMPLMTLKVIAGIHWEALKLWLKGVALHSRPKPPPRSASPTRLRIRRSNLRCGSPRADPINPGQDHDDVHFRSFAGNRTAPDPRSALCATQGARIGSDAACRLARCPLARWPAVPGPWP